MIKKRILSVLEILATIALILLILLLVAGMVIVVKEFYEFMRDLITKMYTVY